MLKQRVLTAVVLLVLVGGPAILLPVEGFVVLAFSVFALAAWEWSQLCGLKTVNSRAAYVVGTLLVLGFGIWLTGLPGTVRPEVLHVLFGVAGAWWALTLLWVQSFPASVPLWSSRVVRGLIGWLVIVPSCLAFIWLRDLGPHIWLVLYVVALVAAADIGAYFVGKRFGRSKLAPAVSPGKSWAGLYGGVFFGLLLAVAVRYLIAVPLPWASWLAISSLTVLSSVLGDLLESMLKRHSGVKDSGSVLPGHGGVLDRIDGWTAASPVFALCLLSAGWPL